MTNQSIASETECEPLAGRVTPNSFRAGGSSGFRLTLLTAATLLDTLLDNRFGFLNGLLILGKGDSRSTG